MAMALAMLPHVRWFIVVFLWEGVSGAKKSEPPVFRLLEAGAVLA